MKQIAKLPIILATGIISATLLTSCESNSNRLKIDTLPKTNHVNTVAYDAEAAAMPVPFSIDDDAFDPEQHMCMALNLYFEARNQSEEDAIALGFVVLNRTHDTTKRFPNNVCDAIKQGGLKRNRCEFSWYCDGKSDAPTDTTAWYRALRLAREVMTNSVKDKTRGALYYHATYVDPYWAKAYTRVAQFGDHILYVSN